jgi:hypothetical protein
VARMGVGEDRQGEGRQGEESGRFHGGQKSTSRAKRKTGAAFRGKRASPTRRC